MNISLNWLRQYVDWPADVDPKDLALKLTMATVEVEEVKKKVENLDGVVVGELLEIKKHPHADKLSIAKVDVGGQVRQIVFGQMVKMSPGCKVPVALAPTILPGNKKIEKTKLRGEESEGMLCLDQELGLAQEGVSIRFFDQDVKNGTPIAKALGLDDVIIEIDNKSVTNRPDLWGHYGLAREVAALYDLPFKDYPAEKIKSGKGVSLKVNVLDAAACPRYMAVALSGVKIAPSPDWLRARLESIGQKSINNIVDVTNYIMYDLGQPLHAFSADKIADAEIIVRRAGKGEKMETIDREPRQLQPNDLVIADKNRAVALAGIMGGADSEISTATETIIIESANFEPATIRQTANRLGLRTEAAIRFEKSLDPNLAETALRRAVGMITQICPDVRAVSAVVDVKNFKQNLGPIELDWSFVNNRIGEVVPPEKIMKILFGLGFGLKKKKAGLLVGIPTWRATKDISIPEDLIEEIARIYGYDNIKPQMPAVALEYAAENKLRQLERQVKNILAHACHASEVCNTSFDDASFLTRLGAPPCEIELQNPWTDEARFMRSSLIPNLLKNVAENLRFLGELNIFEIGKVFTDDSAGEPTKPDGQEHLPSQDLHAAGAVVGADEFFAAKGTVQKICSELNLPVEFTLPDERIIWCHPKQQLNIFIGKERIGYVASVHPEALARAEIKANVGIWDLNLNKMLKFYPALRRYRPLPKFPAVELDLSVLIDDGAEWQAVEKLAKAVDANLISAVRLLDVYKNDKMESGKKSMTFRVVYRATDRTLALEEATNAHAKLAEQIEKAFGAQIRK